MDKKNRAIPEGKTPLEERAEANMAKMRRNAEAEAIIRRMRKEKLGCLDEEIKAELARVGLAWPVD